MRLLFKIEANPNLKYLIRPSIDYIMPNGSRFVSISMDAALNPKKEHQFTCKIVALLDDEGHGLSADQFWKQGRVEKSGLIIFSLFSIMCEQNANAVTYCQQSLLSIVSYPALSLFYGH